jgi:hypothetical protein
VPLVPIILEKGFRDIIERPPKNPIDAANKMAGVYADYARAAASLFGPATFTGAEVRAMAGVLASGFNPYGAPPAASGGLIRGITVFWTAPPVVFGAGVATAFTGAPALGSCLSSSFTNPKVPAAVAAKLLANCFDTATRLVLVTGGGPPFTSPVF